MTTNLITSNPITDGQKKQIRRLLEDAGDKAFQTIITFDNPSAQRLIMSGDKLADKLIVNASELALGQFADEEVESTYVYPAGYSAALVKPIGQQVDEIAKMFSLSLGYTIEFLEKVFPTLKLPDWAEGWFASPSVDALAARFFPKVKDPAARYCEAVKIILAKIAESRSFYNYREGQITPNRYRMNAETAKAMALVMAQQKGDVIVLPGQFGMRHRGRSVRRGREMMIYPEFGPGAVTVGSMLLAHPARLVSYNDLWIDVPGDEFDCVGDGRFGDAPYLRFAGYEVEFGTYDVDDAGGRYGSASASIPQ